MRVEISHLSFHPFMSVRQRLLISVLSLLFLMLTAAVSFFIGIGPDVIRQRIEERIVMSHLTKPRRTAPAQWLQHPVDREAFTVSCRDGDIISAIYCKARHPTGTVVILHGLGTCKDYMAWLARLMNDWGFNAVVYDSRGHGLSSGASITYGHYEKTDLVDIIEVIRSRHPEGGPIGVLGTSMGAAVAAQALPFVPFARCAVLVSPFATFQHEFDATAAGFPFFINREEIRHITEKELGCQISEINPEAAVAQSSVPLLVIHGTKDANISCQQGHELFLSSRSPKSKWFPVDGADHNNILNDGEPWHDEVYGRIREFLTANLATGSISQYPSHFGGSSLY